MKGLIDGLLLFLNNGQIGDYSRNFADNLFKYTDFDINILKDYEIKSSQYTDKSTEILLDRSNDNYDNLVRYINNNGVSFYHCLNNGFSIPKNFDFNYIMTLSNLLPLIHEEYCSVNYLNNFFNKFPYSVMKSSYFIVPSISSKKDFLNNFSVDEKNIFTSYGFVSDFYTKTDSFMSSVYIKSKFNIEFEYIIFYGDFNRRKNLDRAIILFNNIKKRLPNLHFLICSDDFLDIKYLDKLKSICSKFNIINCVHFINKLSIFDKVNLFNNSLFFIDLSSYECLNLNIIEAFKCEIPIVCSNINLYKEYFGDYVFYYENALDYNCVINYTNNFVYIGENILNKFDRNLNLEIIKNIYNKF